MQKTIARHQASAAATSSLPGGLAGRPPARRPALRLLLLCAALFWLAWESQGWLRGRMVRRRVWTRAAAGMQSLMAGAPREPDEVRYNESAPACLTFTRPICPPLDFMKKNFLEQSRIRNDCLSIAAVEKRFGKKPTWAPTAAGRTAAHGRGRTETAARPTAPRFCGRRLARTNPCWEERGVAHCLPLFFILGEMKCGTTTLYHLLTRHPRMVVPTVKEPRFLQQGRFEGTTVSRYAANFDATARRDDAVTFEASPVYLRSPTARTWLSTWMPEAKLIVLVRDPVQRAYSHWKMGIDWMGSKCQSAEEQATLAPIMPHLAFTPIMERSLLLEHWKACRATKNVARAAPKTTGTLGATPPPVGHGLRYVAPPPHGFGLMKLPTAEAELVAAWRAEGGAARGAPPGAELAPTFACLREADAELVDRTLDELTGVWPASAEARSEYVDAGKRVGHCTEMMLIPPGALTKGALYSQELRAWAELFPREQLKVIHTDELSRPADAQRHMDATFEFLGLDPVDVGLQTRMCVHGKAGVMDVLNEKERLGHIGANGTGAPSLQVGPCDEDPETDVGQGMHRHAETGALHHNIDPALSARMRAYYDKGNRDLYDFLGRDLGW